MPFCSQCGTSVAPSALYCGACGAPQPPASATGSAVPQPDPLAGIPARTASILCYVPAIGWICAVIVLASMKFRNNRTVRFHAFQGLYLFVATLMADFVVRPMFWILPDHNHLYQLVQLVLIGASIFMMVKASRDEVYSLPLFGELAERSLSER